MLQYLVWIGIYLLSIKFMTKNAGRNSPVWGAFFVLLSFLIMLLCVGPMVVLAPIFPFIVSNNLIASLSLMMCSFTITIAIVFLLSKVLPKKDLSKRKKETKINYKIASISIAIIGFLMLFLIFVVTKKFDSGFFGLIHVAILSAWSMDARSKINTNITINDLKNKKFILFLRAFSSDTILSEKNTSFLSLGAKGDIDKYINEIVIPTNKLFVSFGNPKDYLPEFGSTKIYTDNDSWKNTIIDYITRADKILILEGLSDGLLWELEYIKTHIQPSKVLMMTYPTSYRNSKSYRTNINYMDFVNKLYLLGYNLPSTDIGAEVFLEFDKNWNSKIKGQGREFLSEYLK